MNLEYRIVKTIGSGSFSIVYLAQSQRTHQYVAIKRIPICHLSNPVLSHIHQEIDIVKKLQHTNIVECLDSYITSRTIYLVMEHCNEGSLDITKSYSFREVKSILYQLLQGLDYLHHNSIVHRDIKPGNILIHNGIVKYCDFGFASSHQENGLMKTFCGTPLYMSPEQLTHQSYTFKTDIWSLGIVFYQLIYHRHPFEPVQNILEYTVKITIPIIYQEQNAFTELLTAMLQIHPEKRKTTQELLSIRLFQDTISSLPSSQEIDEFFTDEEEDVQFEFESIAQKDSSFHQEIQQVLSDYNSNYIRNHIHEDYFQNPNPLSTNIPTTTHLDEKSKNRQSLNSIEIIHPEKIYSQSAPIQIPSQPQRSPDNFSSSNSFGKLFQLTGRVIDSGKRFLSNTLSL